MSLFETIARVQPVLMGWCCPEKAEALAAMVVALHSDVTVEIGVFGGSSFIPLALAHKHIGSGVVIGIDPWSKEEAMKNETNENAEWASKQNYEAIYQEFVKTLHVLGLENVTKIIRQTSNQAPLPNQIDLLHIDGMHTMQAVRDVTKYANRVRVGGICIMDDLDWSGGSVKVAVQRLLEMRFMFLYKLGTGAVYQRL